MPIPLLTDLGGYSARADLRPRGSSMGRKGQKNVTRRHPAWLWWPNRDSWRWYSGAAMTKVDVFFVLNGLHNGERGVYAMTCDERQLRDGWYWMTDEMDDPEDLRAYASREDAIEAGMSWAETIDG
jgi:hypothetical protein